MRLFIFVFFTLYGGMHVYAFLKVRAAVAPGHLAAICLAVFMAIMVFAPVIVRQSEKHGFEIFARLMSYIGYSWMGVLFLFCSASIALDIWRLLVHLAGFLVRKDLSFISPSGMLSFSISALFALSAGIYGYFEARNIVTERIIIESAKISAEAGKLRIVQISDVHIGLIVREERLKRILKKVKEAKPDIFVSTGDLVDGQINSLAGLAELFRDINPKYGRFAVTGNHEFYAGLPQALDFTRKAGFVVLRGEGVTVDGLINIAGVDDPQGKAFGVYKDVSEKEMFSRLPEGKFTLLLKHRPQIDKSSAGHFDLQLSGHVHKGQIFPFSIITGLYYPLQAGFLNIQGNSSLYVSRGAGTWGPPIRFMSPPEVTIIDIVHPLK